MLVSFKIMFAEYIFLVTYFGEWVIEFLPHNAMHKCGLCHSAVSFCPFVTFVCCVEMDKHILKLIKSSGRPTILVFLCQTLWQYSDGNPLMGASNAFP